MGCPLRIPFININFPKDDFTLGEHHISIARKLIYLSLRIPIYNNKSRLYEKLGAGKIITPKQEMGIKETTHSKKSSVIY